MEATAVNSVSASFETTSKTTNGKETKDDFSELLECLFFNLQQPSISVGTVKLPDGKGASQSEEKGNQIHDILHNLGNTDITSIKDAIANIKLANSFQLKGKSAITDDQWLTQLLNQTGDKSPKISDLFKEQTLPDSMDDILKTLNTDNAKDPIYVKQVQKMAEKIVQNILSKSLTSEKTQQNISVDEVKNNLLEVINSLEPQRKQNVTVDDVKSNLLGVINSLESESKQNISVDDVKSNLLEVINSLESESKQNISVDDVKSNLLGVINSLEPQRKQNVTVDEVKSNLLGVINSLESESKQNVTVDEVKSNLLEIIKSLESESKQNISADELKNNLLEVIKSLESVSKQNISADELKNNLLEVINSLESESKQNVTADGVKNNLLGVINSLESESKQNVTADGVKNNLLGVINSLESESKQNISADELRNNLLEVIKSLESESKLSHVAENQIDKVIEDSTETALGTKNVIKIKLNNGNSNPLENSLKDKDAANSKTNNLGSTSLENADENLGNGKLSLDLLNRAVESAKVEKNDNPVIRSSEDLVDVVVNKFNSLKLPEITELKVRLQPKELGEITVKVILEKGQINGSINTSSKEVANVIHNQLDMLKQDLKNLGINLNNITVNTNAEDNFNNKQSRNFFNQGEQKRNPRNFKETFEEIIQNNSADDETFEIIA